jgi:hypothetical protein
MTLRVKPACQHVFVLFEMSCKGLSLGKDCILFVRHLIIGWLCILWHCSARLAYWDEQSNMLKLKFMVFESKLDLQGQGFMTFLFWGTVRLCKQFMNIYYSYMMWLHWELTDLCHFFLFFGFFGLTTICRSLDNFK